MKNTWRRRVIIKKIVRRSMENGVGGKLASFR